MDRLIFLTRRAHDEPSFRLAPGAAFRASAVIAVLLLLSAALWTERAAADTTQVQMAQSCDQSGCTYSFSPSQITVAVGSTVTWVNTSQAPHTATSDSGDPQSFDTGEVDPSGQASVTFTVPGTYTYHCSFHPNMHGTIMVAQTGPAVTATLPPTATETPAPSATPAPTATVPAPLTVHVSLSPRTIRPGKVLHVRVNTRPPAALKIALSVPGLKRAVHTARTSASGSYSHGYRIGRRAKRGRLTVRVTARAGEQSASATAHATVR